MEYLGEKHTHNQDLIRNRKILKMIKLKLVYLLRDFIEYQLKNDLKNSDSFEKII